MVTKLLIGIIRTARPRQWLKNLALFVPLVFGGELLEPGQFGLVLWAFFIFCGLSSSMYILNDIMDVERDRLHPFKKKRPLAAGIIPIPIAWIVMALGLLIFLALAYQLSFYFFGGALSFVLLQVAYTYFLKHVILIDVMTIAGTFLLRVYAGAFVINAHMSVWFLLTVISLSLFLAIGKRRSERTILGDVALAARHRDILLHYPENLLDSLTVMFATSSWLTYTLFTFMQPPPTPPTHFLLFFSKNLPLALYTQKWLMLTVPMVIYGVMRYLYIIYEKKEGESPERVLLSDYPLLTTVVLWVVSLFTIIYLLGM